MSEITSLPNIGGMLAIKLKEAGITSAEELQSLGSEKAFLRINAIDDDACLSKLYALEGAVQGIRWHGLEKKRMSELKEFFRMVKTGKR